MKWLLAIAIVLTACADDDVDSAADAGPNDAVTDSSNLDSGSVDSGSSDAASSDAADEIDVDRGSTVDTLRPSEVEAVCDDFRTQFDELVPPDVRLRFNCTVTGIFTAGFDDSIDTEEELRAACVPIRDMCIEQGSMTDDFVCPLEGENDCSLSVGEVETCFVAESVANAEFFSTITCEEATLEQADGEGLGDAEVPDECATVYSECPGLR